MSSTITGTWEDVDSKETIEISLIVNGATTQVVMTPNGSPWWSSTKDGKWNGASVAPDQWAQGNKVPYFGSVIFLNNAGQHYECDFSVSSNCEWIVFANGVIWQKQSEKRTSLISEISVVGLNPLHHL